jgi:hypothetical protein
MDELSKDLHAARVKTDEVARVSAMAKLLPRLTPPDRSALIAEILSAAREFENRYLLASAFAELLPHMTGLDLDLVAAEAIQAARDIVDPSSRSTIFARLAPLLPEHERAFALIEAWSGTSHVDAKSRGQALAEFMVQQGQPDQNEILEEALQEAGQLREADTWLDAMRPLLKHLPKSMLESLGVGSRGIHSIPARVQSLARLGTDLSEPEKEILLEQALSTARSATDPESRADALHLLSPFLPAPARTVVLREALEAIRAITFSREQTPVLKRLAPSLPPDLLEEGFGTAMAVWDKHERMSALVALAPFLPESFHPRVITAIMQEKDQTLRVGTLVDLTRILPKTFFDVLRDEVSRVADNERRAYALLQVVDLCSRTEGQRVLASAVEAARLIPDAISRVRALIALAYHFPDAVKTAVLMDAVETARLIPDAISRVRTLIALAYHFPGAVKTAVLMDAVATVRGLEGEHHRMDALMKLAKDVPRPQFMEFLILARSTADWVMSEETLQAITDQAEESTGSAGIVGRPILAQETMYAEPSAAEASESFGPFDVPSVLEPRSRKRVINTGFANPLDPAQALDATASLSAGNSYYFWVDVGLPDEKSIEVSPTPLPTFSGSVRLKVALVPIDGEIVIDPAAAVGELELRPDGSALVVSQPGPIKNSGSKPELPKQRLFFRLHAAQAGLFRFRCNIYYEHILVQSRLISVRVTERSRFYHQALRSHLDYTLSGTLDPSHLKRLTPHQMSLLLVTGEKTLSFSFFGAAGDEVVKREATFDVLELQDAIEQARSVLRRVAWGDEEDWQPTKNYRYGGKITFEKFQDDLISLALRGYRLYDSIVDRVTGSRERSRSLKHLMRAPGMIQIAIAESPRQHIPSALFYDYHLETGIERNAYKICPGFLHALKDNSVLDDSECFQGQCSSRNSPGEDRVICPSGFWGFRHELGMPLSVAAALDAPSEITYEHAPQMTVGISTDPAFTLWAGHERVMRDLRKNLGWTCATSRSVLFDVLRKSNPHVVYLYCHGGMANGVPYIQVGPLSEYVITRDNFRNARIDWEESWPLIFINGCKTADLEPGRALELVSACIQSSASGVVGTEITLFEPLACAFAEEFMRRFLAGLSVGKAIRGARLALLKSSNPLGLVYIPYSLASLRLVESHQ